MLQETGAETRDSAVAGKELLQTGVSATHRIEEQIRRAEAALQEAQDAKNHSKSPSHLLSKWAGF